MLREQAVEGNNVSFIAGTEAGIAVDRYLQWVSLDELLAEIIALEGRC
jgi:hypothetical protein